MKGSGVDIAHIFEQIGTGDNVQRRWTKLRPLIVLMQMMILRRLPQDVLLPGIIVGSDFLVHIHLHMIDSCDSMHVGFSFLLK